MRHRMSIETYLYRLEKHSDWYCKNHKFDSLENKKCAVVIMNFFRKTLLVSAFLTAMLVAAGIF